MEHLTSRSQIWMEPSR